MRRHRQCRGPQPVAGKRVRHRRPPSRRAGRSGPGHPGHHRGLVAPHLRRCRRPRQCSQHQRRQLCLPHTRPASMPASISRDAGIANTDCLSKDLAGKILVSTVCTGLIRSGQQQRLDSRIQKEPDLSIDAFCNQLGHRQLSALGPRRRTRRSKRCHRLPGLRACQPSLRHSGHASSQPVEELRRVTPPIPGSERW